MAQLHEGSAQVSSYQAEAQPPDSTQSNDKRPKPSYGKQPSHNYVINVSNTTPTPTTSNDKKPDPQDNSSTIIPNHEEAMGDVLSRSQNPNNNDGLIQPQGNDKGHEGSKGHGGQTNSFGNGKSGTSEPTSPNGSNLSNGGGSAPANGSTMGSGGNIGGNHGSDENGTSTSPASLANGGEQPIKQY